MCPYINTFDTNTKFVILMHPKEFKKVKNNTGYLTKKSLSNSELFIGINFSNNNRINEIIAEGMFEMSLSFDENICFSAICSKIIKVI